MARSSARSFMDAGRQSAHVHSHSRTACAVNRTHVLVVGGATSTNSALRIPPRSATNNAASGAPIHLHLAMAQFGDVLAGDVLAFEEVEDEPAPAAGALEPQPRRRRGGREHSAVTGLAAVRQRAAEPQPGGAQPARAVRRERPGQLPQGGVTDGELPRRRRSPASTSRARRSSSRRRRGRASAPTRGRRTRSSASTAAASAARAAARARDGSTTRFRRLRLSDGRGITLRRAAAPARRLFCGYSDGGVLVAALEPECAAAAAGFLVGDLIVRIGETLATDHAQVIGAIESLRGVSAGACEVTVVDSVMEVLLRPGRLQLVRRDDEHLPGGGGVVVSELRAAAPPPPPASSSASCSSPPTACSSRATRRRRARSRP